MIQSSSSLPINVWILTLAQSLIGSIGPVIVFVGGFIGLQLAPSESYATLPVACMIIGIATFMWPSVHMSAKIGRKPAFILASATGALNCWLTVTAINQQNFWLFCCAIFLFGFTLATVQQFRFAAMESVAPELAGKAVSTLLLAGLAAAFIGPEVAFVFKDSNTFQFSGSFVAVAVLLLTASGILLFFKETAQTISHQDKTARPLSEIVRQPIFIAAITTATAGFAIMSFVMTATPISMHVHSGISMADTKWVIQSHIIAMYLPSFITGRLIARFGHSRLLYAGIIIFLLCLAIGFWQQAYLHYWAALVLLGVAWNFMFITATALLPESYQEHEKFKVQGLNDFVIFAAQAIASLSAGWVMHVFGWQVLLLSCIPVLLITAMSIYYWRSCAINKTEM